jgi:hypothetical protein
MISKLKEPFISLAQAQQVFFFQRKQSSHWKLVIRSQVLSIILCWPLGLFTLERNTGFFPCLHLGLFTLERNTEGKWSALKENPKRKDVLHANT